VNLFTKSAPAYISSVNSLFGIEDFDTWQPGVGQENMASHLFSSYTMMSVERLVLGGSKHFLTFVDDCTRYLLVYILKPMCEVFKRFRE